MKQYSIFRKVAQIALVMLFFSANSANAIQAAKPELVLSVLPPLGHEGYAEGKVVWDNLTPQNAERYAVIAMLHAVWDRCGGYYVKPYEDNYLNAIDKDGSFSILITTGGIDVHVDEVIFYVVERASISAANTRNPATMTGKYLATTTIYRKKWVNPPPRLASNIRPGFVPAGTEISLSCQEGDTIRFTLDGSNPMTSSSAQTYHNQTFTIMTNKVLLVKAAVKTSKSYSPVFSLVWLHEEPLSTPFWGLNVSLALKDERFGHLLLEATTRERMLPVARLTKWIRTFGTINNGQEYINQIAKQLNMRTMIGVYITNDVVQNKAQLEGLRKILQTGPAPDLIAVGNETSLIGIDPNIFESCINFVREMVLEQGFVIPIGSVDLINASWKLSLLQKLDFIGVNIYNGTLDATPENQMLDGVKQAYSKAVSSFSSKLIVLTETGTPYAGNTYSVFDGTKQTPSKDKAANFLCEFLDWIKKENIPAFYFEAYDEPAKSKDGGHPIEQYFGIMDGNLQIHPFYNRCLPVSK